MSLLLNQIERMKAILLATLKQNLTLLLSLKLSVMEKLTVLMN
jgi:hypothetical protein